MDVSCAASVPVEIGGEEAESAILGALTTPGTAKPMAILLDLGQAQLMHPSLIKKEKIKAIHLAGAGNMVTMLINSELGLEDMHIAEAIKRDPLARYLAYITFVMKMEPYSSLMNRCRLHCLAALLSSLLMDLFQ